MTSDARSTSADHPGPEQPDPASLSAVPGLFDLVQATRDLGAANGAVRVAIARYLGIGVSDVIALIHLHAFGPMTQRELADGLGVTASAVTVMLDRLEPHGIVRRTPHPTDRRRTLIEVYDDDRDQLGVYGVMAAPYLALDEDERREAVTLLKRLQTIVVESAAAVAALPPLAPSPSEESGGRASMTR